MRSSDTEYEDFLNDVYSDTMYNSAVIGEEDDDEQRGDVEEENLFDDYDEEEWNERENEEFEPDVENEEDIDDEKLLGIHYPEGDTLYGYSY